MARIIMVGECPATGAKVVSRFPFEIGICKCENPHVEVQFELAILPAKRHIKHLRQVAEFRNTSVRKLVAELLDIWL